MDSFAPGCCLCSRFRAELDGRDPAVRVLIEHTGDRSRTASELEHFLPITHEAHDLSGSAVALRIEIVLVTQGFRRNVHSCHSMSQHFQFDIQHRNTHQTHATI